MSSRPPSDDPVADLRACCSAIDWPAVYDDAMSMIITGLT